MIFKCIGLVIGILVLAAGLYYRAKEKADLESRRIYTVVSIVGGLLAAVMAVLILIALL